MGAATWPPRLTLEEVDREHIHRMLEMTGWRVRGRNGAAEMLGVKPTTLESRMAKLGIHRRAEDRTKQRIVIRYFGGLASLPRSSCF